MKEKTMDKIFPSPIQSLPQANIPIRGITAYLSQSDSHQIIFMHFADEVDLPEHAHAAQWGVVLEGSITLKIDGDTKTYAKGDRYFIPAGINHSGRIHAGYADITFFDQADRYWVKT